MVRKIVAATASAALCLSTASPVLAQSYAFSGFDAPRGATATLNLRVPLGDERAVALPTYGLTLGYGQTIGAQSLDGRTTSREMRFADLRFNGQQVAKARVLSFDLANLEEDGRSDLMGGSTLLIVGIVAGAVAICLLAECFEGDDDDPDDDNN